MSYDIPAMLRAWRGILAQMAEAEHERAALVGRHVAPATLIAVSKRQPVDHMCALYDAGQRDFGENYVQELVPKAQHMARTGRSPRWHMIGPLQRNKAHTACSIGATVHTVDSFALAQKLSDRAARTASVLPVLLQVRLAQDLARAGVPPQDTVELAQKVLPLPGLNVAGLMGMPAADGNAQAAFARLKALSDQLRELAGARNASALSMGMSDDFRVAILEGATMVRVGSQLFGPRT